jgi:hypothetical protein
MSLLFLADMPLGSKEALAGLGLGAGALALIAAFIVVLFIVMVLVYIYSSFAYMAIAKKAKYSMPGLAWIPVVGPLIVTAKIAKMHWWPILLLIGFWIPIIGGILNLVVFVFSIIWLWKTFEAIKKPEWWAILCIIPIVNLVILGIAAWSKK